MRLCFRCKCVIAADRLEVLPETHTCKECSTVQGYVGAMIWTSKTTPELVYVRPENAEAVETLKREYNRARV
jgi:hypothetical protein